MNNNNDSVPESVTRLCANNCGFFGSPGMNNFCSVCFKKLFAEKRMAVEKEPAPAPLPAAAPVFEEKVKREETEKIEEKRDEAPPSVEKKKKVQRCAVCKKKVGLTGITCRCGGLYCGSHRYAEQHSCAFDYRAAERAELEKRNPGGGLFEKIQKV